MIFVISVKSQNLNDIYELLPDVQNCKPGILKQTEIDKVISLVNKIRLLHKLPPVEYEYSSQQASMEGCLNIVASGESGHVDDPSSECYTPQAGQARIKSNLFAYRGSNPLNVKSEDIIIGWMIDDKNFDKLNEYKVGHRRAIINPFLKKFSFGRSEGYSKKTNLYMIASNFYYQDYANGSTNANVDFVAYPYENYPINYFNKDFYLSFNVIANKSNLWQNQNVSFANVSVKIKDENNNYLNVYDIKSDNEGWGSYPNNLSWKVSGLKDETKYFVEINNVNVNGQIKSYNYWFRLTDINHSSKPAPPILLSPLNFAKNIKTSTTFSWEASQNAAKYNFQISDDKQFKNLIHNLSNINNNSFYVSNLDYQKTYYWRVSATNDAGTSDWSEIWEFTTSDSKLISPELLAPKNNDIVNTVVPRLEWEKIQSAENYLVQVSITNNFSGFNVKLSKTVNDNFLEIPFGILQTNTTYYWRVMAKNNNGDSDWSNIWSFNTGTALPKVILIYPSNNSENISLTTTLEWQKIDNATSYQIQLNRKPEFDIEFVIYENDIIDNFYKIPENSLKTNTTYYWRVRGKNNNGFGEWSEVFSFRTVDITSILNANENINLVIKNDNLLIQNNLNIPFNIKIYNLYGKVVYTNNVTNSNNFKLDKLSNGIYFILFEFNNNKFIEKIIINK